MFSDATAVYAEYIAQASLNGKVVFNNYKRDCNVQ
jgi:hypothetical protein